MTIIKLCLPLYHKDGDHYKRQYNNTNSWSLKYNLAFQVKIYRLYIPYALYLRIYREDKTIILFSQQKVLDFDLFPDSVFTTEENYYQKMVHEVQNVIQESMHVCQLSLPDSMEFHWMSVQTSLWLTGRCLWQEWLTSSSSRSLLTRFTSTSMRLQTESPSQTGEGELVSCILQCVDHCRSKIFSLCNQLS